MISQNEISLDNVENVGDSVNVGEHDNVVEDFLTPRGIREQELPENPTSSRSKKGKRVEIDEVASMTKSMDNFAKAIIKTSEDLVHIFKPRELFKDFDMWKYVEDIGIDSHLYYVTCTYLLDNPQRLEFLNSTPIEHRKNLLMLWIEQ
ncbi:hypothetical protein M5689_006439 [Euphorbia peplus]|nr:hypothetical protein M5689_006439 [Euphorbia peplus]